MSPPISSRALLAIQLTRCRAGYVESEPLLLPLDGQRPETAVASVVAQPLAVDEHARLSSHVKEASAGVNYDTFLKVRAEHWAVNTDSKLPSDERGVLRASVDSLCHRVRPHQAHTRTLAAAAHSRSSPVLATTMISTALSCDSFVSALRPAWRLAGGILAAP